MTTEYEVVGVLDVDATDAVGADAETILVEHDDPNERLVCRPKDES
jgi:hypothetical protein